MAQQLRTVFAAGTLAVALATSGCGGGSARASSKATPTAKPSSAALPGHLLFTTTTDGDVQTINLGVDGKFGAITQPGDYCCLNRISPDHRLILTVPGGDIAPPVTGGTIDLHGSHFQRLRIPAGTLNLIPQAWSPDGTRIAYEGWDDSGPSRTGVYTALASNGGQLIRVTRRPGSRHDIPLDFSPDGKSLVYYRSAHDADSDPKTGGSLWVVRADGTGNHEVSGASHPADWARWSPDGSKILFANERLSPTGALWVVSTSGEHLTKLFSGSAQQFPIAPTWAPDGQQILFAMDPTNDEFTHPANSLDLIASDGSNLRSVLSDSRCKRSLEWW